MDSSKPIVTPTRTGWVGAGIALVSWALDKLFPSWPDIVPLAVLFIGVALIGFALVRAFFDRNKQPASDPRARAQIDHIHGLAADRLRCVKGRIGYAKDAGNGVKDPSVWFDKLAFKNTQGVPYEELKTADSELLSLKQKKALQISRGHLGELEDWIKSVINNPNGYDTGATVPYLHRAEAARDALRKLISTLKEVR